MSNQIGFDRALSYRENQTQHFHLANVFLPSSSAGVSVDSGIRAYRGPEGSYTRAGKEHRPIFYHEFIAAESFRRRYWARSYLGYVPVREADPNPTHYSIAALSTLGVIDKLM